jgi:hypothetical protein
MVADMDRVRAYYKPEWAKYPELFTLPRLKEEETIERVPEQPATVEPARTDVADVATG